MKAKTIFLAMLAAVLFAGCSPKTIPYPVERVRYERVEADTAKFMALINSLREQMTQKESRIESLIHKESDKETIVLNDKGDTVSHNRNHNVYIHLTEKERQEYERIIKSCRDSIGMLTERLASVKADSIPVPYPVERPLTKWEQTKMDFGGMAMGGVAALALVASVLIAWLVKVKRRR